MTPAKSQRAEPQLRQDGGIQLPPGIVRALRVFRRHFSTLLAEHPGRWAACDSNEVLFVGDGQEPLYRQCLDRGLQEDEFVVLCLLPDATEYID